MANIYNKLHPKNFDEAVGYIQQSLNDNLPFLNNIFGICERTVKMIDGRKYYSPSWFLNKYDYINLLPDDKLGNYCFFTLDEPREIEHEQGLKPKHTSGFNIIIWVDMRDNILTDDDRNLNWLLEYILEGIYATHMVRGRFTIDKVYNRAENIFQGFTTDEVDNQYLMQPYTGFRLHGEITIYEECLNVQ